MTPTNKSSRRAQAPSGAAETVAPSRSDDERFIATLVHCSRTVTPGALYDYDLSSVLSHAADRIRELSARFGAPPAAYSIDADALGIRARAADAITGALAFGAQGVNPPPAGHWLAPFWDMARAERNAPAAQASPVTYSSTQATQCACCGKRKHTPLRVDGMGGYVCLTCIDTRLEELLDAEADAAAQANQPVAVVCHAMARDGRSQPVAWLGVSPASLPDGTKLYAIPVAATQPAAPGAAVQAYGSIAERAQQGKDAGLWDAPPTPPVAGALAERKLLGMVLDDMTTCCSEREFGYEFKELSTETVEALDQYRAALAATPASSEQAAQATKEGGAT